MTAELKIKYVVDSIEGNSLSTTVTGGDHGWAEYCNQRGQLFYANAVSDDFYKKCHQQAIDTIVSYALKSDKKHLGFINHLSTVLIDHEFVLLVE